MNNLTKKVFADKREGGRRRETDGKGGRWREGMNDLTWRYSSFLMNIEEGRGKVMEGMNDDT